MTTLEAILLAIVLVLAAANVELWRRVRLQGQHLFVVINAVALLIQKVEGPDGQESNERFRSSFDSR